MTVQPPAPRFQAFHARSLIPSPMAPRRLYYRYPTSTDNSNRSREGAPGIWRQTRSRLRERPHLPLKPAWPSSSEEGPAPRCPHPLTPPAARSSSGRSPASAQGGLSGLRLAISVLHTVLLDCTLISFRIGLIPFWPDGLRASAVTTEEALTARGGLSCTRITGRLPGRHHRGSGHGPPMAEPQPAQLAPPWSHRGH